MKRTKKTWHGQTPKKRNAATSAVLAVMNRWAPYAWSIAEVRGRLDDAPYAPVAQAIRRLRLAGLVRRADGKRGPGRAATYALTARGKTAAERAARF